MALPGQTVRTDDESVDLADLLPEAVSPKDLIDRPLKRQETVDLPLDAGHRNIFGARSAMLPTRHASVESNGHHSTKRDVRFQTPHKDHHCFVVAPTAYYRSRLDHPHE